MIEMAVDLFIIFTIEIKKNYFTLSETKIVTAICT